MRKILENFALQPGIDIYLFIKSLNMTKTEYDIYLIRAHDFQRAV